MNNDMISLDLANLEKYFPDDFSDEELARGKTILLKKLSLALHKHYNGKIQMLPKAGIFGFNWFNIWYTPGVSAVSTSIRDNNELSYELSNRGNCVAVVSDSTRVLGDGDCTPPGGLGVMEGKALLMKYLGGIDAVPLCIDSRDKNGKNSPDKIIDFVKMVQHSFGAINLEDISQPNCYRVLDTLREECEIPVWHDDAQGTASVTLAGLINALKLTGKDIGEIRTVFLGAGASNTAIARICFAAGMDPGRCVMFDTKGALHKDRVDIASNSGLYRKWEICQSTNPGKIKNIEDAFKGADLLIALSKPDPNYVQPAWIKMMKHKPIIFVCANPVPEIYPYAAKKAGAYIVATGRGDFPNQVNNSLGFPGILKGALIVRARKITDTMAIAAARSLAKFAEDRGIDPENIIPKMDEAEVFPQEAVAVARAAINEGMARKILSDEVIFKIAQEDIRAARESYKLLESNDMIRKPDLDLIRTLINDTIKDIRDKRL